MTVIIAGERSGVGKTTITLAILAYLCERPSLKSAPNPFPPANSPAPRSSLNSKIQDPKSKILSLVQSFKVGPDYIDPMFHTYVTGRPCRNLDPVLTSQTYVQQCFVKHCQGTDYSVVEGVMGLFDGASGTDDTASTAHIARLLNIPIVLVLDCSRLSRSVAAIIHGYTTFDPRLNCAGVILNRVGSDRHLHLLKTAIEPLNLPILGVLRRETHITIPDRHLGLIPTDELPALDQMIAELRAIASTRLNWELLLPLLHTTSLATHPASISDRGTPNAIVGLTQGIQPIASTPLQDCLTPQLVPETVGEPSVEPFTSQPSPCPADTPANRTPTSNIQTLKTKIRIAIARDRAFNFYYADNLDLLEQLGATLLFWSPLTDPTLPTNIQGLYLGGGFPEVFATELAANHSAKESVKTAIESGLPTYAECGGLMYLCESIVDFEEVEHSMVGLVPTTVSMGKRLSLGYREAIVQHSTPLVKVGETLWGHEFHRSHLSQNNPSPVYEFYGYDRHRDGNHHSWGGWSYRNLHASYLHVHWGERQHIPQRFLTYCQTWQPCSM